MRTILVPLDGSVLAESAVPTAGAIARRDGARLLLVAVHEPVTVMPGGHAAIGLAGTRDAYARAALDETLGAARDRIAHVLPGVAVESRLLTGAAAETLAQAVETEHADLVVITTHGRGGLSRLWLGSVTDALIRRVAVPVLVLHPAPERHEPSAPVAFRRVLVALDGTPASEAMIDTAQSVAGSEGVEYILLRVAPALHPLLQTIASDAELQRDATEQHALAEHDVREVEARCVVRRLDVRIEVRTDLQPARAILDAARELGADLIAIATHGRGPAGRLLLGSVADKVIRAAEIPVLVGRLRPETAQTELPSTSTGATTILREHQASARPLPAPSPPSLDRIVVALDFAGPSRAAADWTARYLAPASTVILTYAIDIAAPPAFLGYASTVREQLLENARRGAETRMRESTLEDGTDRLRTEIREGHPASVVAGVARDHRATLVVVGEHGGRAGISGLLGGTARRIVSHARVPVLVARALADAPPRTILAAVTDDEDAQGVLDWGTFLAGRAAGSLVILYVSNPVDTALVTGDLGDQDRARTESWLESKARAARASGVAVSTMIAGGDPVTEILRAARDRGADLIVVGRGGYGRLARAFIGSVSEAVARRADRCVLVVPAASRELP